MLKRNDNRRLNKPKDRIKEVVDCEIELKLNYFGKYGRRALNKLRPVFVNSNYQLVEGLSELAWVFNFDYYGYRKDNKATRLFVLIHHPSTGKFWLRRKGDYKQTGGRSAFLTELSRSEKTTLFERKLSKKIKQKLVGEEATKIDKRVELIGRIVREKKYFMIEKMATSRTYWKV